MKVLNREHVGITVIIFVCFGACFSTSVDSSLLYAMTSSSALLKSNEPLRALEFCMSLLKESMSVERSFLKDTAFLTRARLEAYALNITAKWSRDTLPSPSD